MRRARRVGRPLASLSRQRAQGDGAARRGQEAPGALPGLRMAQRTVVRSADPNTVAEVLTTHQACLDVCRAIGSPHPPHPCRGTPHALTGLRPDWGLAVAFPPLLWRLSGTATWRSHVVWLVPSAQHVDGPPRAVCRRRVGPAPPRTVCKKKPWSPAALLPRGP